jgi:hypothetical protein
MNLRDNVNPPPPIHTHTHTHKSKRIMLHLVQTLSVALRGIPVNVSKRLNVFTASEASLYLQYGKKKKCGCSGSETAVPDFLSFQRTKPYLLAPSTRIQNKRISLFLNESAEFHRPWRVCGTPVDKHRKGRTNKSMKSYYILRWDSYNPLKVKRRFVGICRVCLHGREYNKEQAVSSPEVVVIVLSPSRHIRK